jgi:hypothetical protein
VTLRAATSEDRAAVHTNKVQGAGRGRLGSSSPWPVLGLACVTVAALTGCGPSNPDPTVASGFATEGESQQQDQLTVRVRGLSNDETRRYFGASTASAGVQAVWIQVRNDGDTAVRFLPILTDPNYFSPQEVAQQLHGWFSSTTNALIDAAFERNAMRSFVGAHSTLSGFAYTHADGGLKFMNVGLIAADKSWRFRFLVTIPGREYAVQRVDFRGLYAPGQIVDLTVEQLRARVAALPCCVTDKSGSAKGDPLNLVVIGNGINAAFPFAARGWRLNEPVDASSSLRMTKAFLLHSAYDTAPVSPLYLFGRYQDLAFQKARSSVSRRNHLRLWLAPFTVDQRLVWIGQISRDIGVKLTTKSWYLTTHRISPYIDQERDYLLQDLLLTGLVDRVGFVAGVGASTSDQPRQNLTDDPYYTDGLRLVVFLGDTPHAPLAVDWLTWERPSETR